jgi:hypothetical protein
MQGLALIEPEEYKAWSSMGLEEKSYNTRVNYD